MTPLTPRQRRAWEKVGDVLVPGGQGLPAFSASGVSRHLEACLECSPPEDRRDLLVLVTLLAWLPAPLLRLLLSVNAALRSLPGAAGAPFRLLELGLRGVVFTVYYAGLDDGGRVHETIDCHIHCEPMTGEDT